MGVFSLVPLPHSRSQRRHTTAQDLLRHETMHILLHRVRYRLPGSPRPRHRTLYHSTIPIPWNRKWISLFWDQNDGWEAEFELASIRRAFGGSDFEFDRVLVESGMKELLEGKRRYPYLKFHEEK